MAEDRGSPARALLRPRALATSAPGPDELRRAREVLEAVAGDRSLLAQLPEEERLKLLMAAGRTVHPEIEQKRRLVKARRAEKRRRIEAHDRSALAGTGIRAARESEVFVPPPRLLGAGAPPLEPPREVLKPKTCYVCKAEYRDAPRLLRRAVPRVRASSTTRSASRRATSTGRVALVTGARVKIGYQAALMLLRAGATVIATTRFPHDAARRYASEPDFADVGRPPAGPRPRPAPLAERRALRAATSSHGSAASTCSSTTPPRRCAARRASSSTCSTFEERPLEALPAELQPVVRSHHDCVRLARGRDRAGRRAPPARASAASWPGAAASRAGPPPLGALSQVRVRLRRGRAARATCSPTARSTPTCSRSTCAR